MIMVIAKGLGGGIRNGMDSRVRTISIAAEPLAGRDSFCMNDLKAFGAGMFAGKSILRIADGKIPPVY